MTVYAKQKSENPLQAGQTAYAHIEFWGWGWWGPYMISQYTTDLINVNSPDDTWIKLNLAAVAPEEALNSHVVVVFNNPSGNSSGAIHFDDLSYRSNVHNEN